MIRAVSVDGLGYGMCWRGAREQSDEVRSIGGGRFVYCRLSFRDIHDLCTGELSDMIETVNVGWHSELRLRK